MKKLKLIILLTTCLIACKKPPPKQLLDTEWVSLEENKSGKYDTLHFTKHSLLLNGLYISVDYDGNKIFESNNNKTPIAEVVELNRETLAIRLFGQGSYKEVKMGYFRSTLLKDLK